MHSLPLEAFFLTPELNERTGDVAGNKGPVWRTTNASLNLQEEIGTFLCGAGILLISTGVTKQLVVDEANWKAGAVQARGVVASIGAGAWQGLCLLLSVVCLLLPSWAQQPSAQGQPPSQQPSSGSAQNLGQRQGCQRPRQRAQQTWRNCAQPDQG